MLIDFSKVAYIYGPLLVICNNVNFCQLLMERNYFPFFSAIYDNNGCRDFIQNLDKFVNKLRLSIYLSVFSFLSLINSWKMRNKCIFTFTHLWFFFSTYLNKGSDIKVIHIKLAVLSVFASASLLYAHRWSFRKRLWRGSLINLNRVTHITQFLAFWCKRPPENFRYLKIA